jgi:hypothetical protein
MKLCLDSQCNRKGTKLSLSGFPKTTRNKTGRYSYCRKCAVRRATENRNKNRARREELNARRREQQRKLRADKTKSKELSVAERVYQEIGRGKQTFDEVEAATGFHEDAVGDAVAHLWDSNQIRIVDRKFYPITKAA